MEKEPTPEQIQKWKKEVAKKRKEMFTNPDEDRHENQHKEKTIIHNPMRQMQISANRSL